MSFKIKRIISEKSVSLHNGELATFVASSHLQREICCVLKGRSHYMLNNQVFKAVPGTVFLIGRQMPPAFGYRECDAALDSVMLDNMADSIELYKQFSDDPNFKKWLATMVFQLTYNTAGKPFVGGANKHAGA